MMSFIYVLKEDIRWEVVYSHWAALTSMHVLFCLRLIAISEALICTLALCNILGSWKCSSPYVA